MLAQYIADEAVSLYAVRAIADLAANNPNNQTKLGVHGACEALVTFLRGTLPPDDRFAISHAIVTLPAEQRANMAKWGCWAVGNIVQLGKGAAMVIDEGAGKKAARSTVTVKNTARLGSAGGDEVLVAVLAAFSTDAAVAQWASRAINNLAKSKTLRGQLLEKGAMEALEDAATKHEAITGPAGQPPAREWIDMAIATLKTIDA